jgi:hypothetical protein
MVMALFDSVLKKISHYVKTIIFGHSDWISRSEILTQIYRLDNSTSEFTATNSVTRSNLKRRVYDSINVLYASDIVNRRKELINLKKEYFFRPKGPIGTNFTQADFETIRKRENIKMQIGQKLKNLDQANRRSTFLSIRHAVLERLIARNKSSSVMQVTTIDLSKPVSLKMSGTQRPIEKLSRGTSRSSKGDGRSPAPIILGSSGVQGIGKSVSYAPNNGEQGKIRLPCYFCPINGRQVKWEKESNKYTLQSTSPQVCYQDFELIGTLWNWNQNSNIKNAK